MQFSLPALSEELRVEAEAAGSALARRPLKEEGSLRQLAIRLREGGELPEHGNPGEAMLLVLEGAVRFIETGSGAEWTLSAGDLFSVPEAQHRVVAVRESMLLLSYIGG